MPKPTYASHPQCERCWIAANGSFDSQGAQVRRRIVMLEPRLETCCFCGSYTVVGIYVRARTQDLLCATLSDDEWEHGEHPEGQMQYPHPPDNLRSTDEPTSGR